MEAIDLQVDGAVQVGMVRAIRIAAEQHRVEHALPKTRRRKIQDLTFGHDDKAKKG